MKTKLINQKEFIISAQNPELYTTKRFLEESKRLNYSTITHINPLHFIIPQSLSRLTDKKNIFLHRTTGTNFDDFDLLVANFFEIEGYRISNPLAAIKNFRDKDMQSLFLKSKKIKCINSLVFRGNIDENLKAEIESLTPKDKFVLKTNRGNQGIGVSFINGLTSLYSVLETLKAMRDQRFIIQPFIEHIKEYRVLIIKGQIHAVIEKTIDEGDFRGNSKRSKAAHITTINHKLSELALEAFNASELDYAGIDILQDNEGEFHLIEINSVCGFEQVETLSGLNIAREIILSLA